MRPPYPGPAAVALASNRSPRKEGVVVKALEGREERQGLDLRRWVYAQDEVGEVHV